MNEIQFVALVAALVGSFIWLLATRKRNRATRAIGVLVLLVTWIAWRVVTA